MVGLMIFSKLRRAKAGVEHEAGELNSLARVISDATAEARKERDELRILKTAYEDLANQLIGMIHTAGYLWQKDAAGRHLFASQSFCELFWRDSVCDVYGQTDADLLDRFWKRFPEGVFTFGDNGVCDGSDEYMIKQGRKCRFLELGWVQTSKESMEPMLALRVDKTPIYHEGEYTGYVGMAMRMDCEELGVNLPRWEAEKVVTRLGRGLYVFNETPGLTCCTPPGLYPWEGDVCSSRQKRI